MTISVNNETFSSEVLEQTKLVLVDFWAEWCLFEYQSRITACTRGRACGCGHKRNDASGEIEYPL